MNLKKLLIKINMPAEIAATILQIDQRSAQLFDWPNIYSNLFNWTSDQRVLETVNHIFKEPDNTYILWIHLRLSLEAWKKYKKLKIDDEVFFDTMAYFSRTVREGKKETGKYSYNNIQWGIRQLTLREFRLGTLDRKSVV